MPSPRAIPPTRPNAPDAGATPRPEPRAAARRGGPEVQLVLFWRVRPDALRALLPVGAEPLVLRGKALLSLAYAHAGGGWVAQRLGAPAHGLACRVPVELRDRTELDGVARRRATFVPRRATSSWLGAHLGPRLHGAAVARARFALRVDGAHIALDVHSADREELVLRAESAPAAPADALLRDRREVEALLRSTAYAFPRDPLAREADALHGPRDASRTLEPLLVHQLRTLWIESLGLGAEDATFDAAYRSTRLRTLPVGPALRSPAAEAVDLSLSTT